MKTTIAISTVLLALLASAAAAADARAPDVQIAAAVLAAPAELREGAAVLGYNPQGEVVRLREGKNELICLANDPGKTSFSVACYHKRPGAVHGSRP
jgi:opacity protein-like surface antigen